MWQTAYYLEKINPSNTKAITNLERFLDKFQNEETKLAVADRLEKIDPGNKNVISVLVEIFCTSQNHLTLMQIAEKLVKIDIEPGNKELFLLIQFLKKSHKLRNYENEIIWKCAQNMSYPAFYQAWHQL